MEKTPNFELFYDVLDESITALYEIKHDSFFNLLIASAKNILASDVLNEDATSEAKAHLLLIYERLEDVDFNVEEIRKAFQMMVLRACNEENLHKGDITPDTIGIFLAYLINKLKPKAKKLAILDPLVGTGNLLYSVANHLDCDLKLFGIDNAKEPLELATVLGNLLNYDIEMYLQDSLLHPFKDMDLCVADINSYELKENEIYFPYLVILMHLASLKDDGYFLSIAPNDFFEHDKDNFFKEHLKDLGSVLGVLQLPTNMFQANPKSIIIFSKKPLESKKCLLVDLPSFSNPNELNKALLQIEDWFLKNMKEEE